MYQSMQNAHDAAREGFLALLLVGGGIVAIAATVLIVVAICFGTRLLWTAWDNFSRDQSSYQQQMKSNADYLLKLERDGQPKGKPPPIRDE
jgi:hypothetical protein